MEIIKKEAIEKAITGEWMHEGMEVIGVELIAGDPTGCHLVIGTSSFQRYRAKRAYAQLALDPSFWQALGKALGWEEERRNLTRYSKETWHLAARRFYDLILTGGDTEAFWKEILTARKTPL